MIIKLNNRIKLWPCFWYALYDKHVNWLISHRSKDTIIKEASDYVSSIHPFLTLDQSTYHEISKVLEDRRIYIHTIGSDRYFSIIAYVDHSE